MSNLNNQNMCTTLIDFSYEKPIGKQLSNQNQNDSIGKENDIQNAAEDAFNSMKDNNFICAVRRFPALMITLACEMVVAFVIS